MGFRQISRVEGQRQVNASPVALTETSRCSLPPGLFSTSDAVLLLHELGSSTPRISWTIAACSRRGVMADGALNKLGRRKSDGEWP